MAHPKTKDLIELFSSIRSASSLLKRRDPALCKEIDDQYGDLSEVIFSEKVFLFVNDLISRPKCFCGKDRKFRNFKLGYQPTCSTKCGSNLESTKKKRKLTNLERYGDESHFRNSTVIDRIRATNIERYGHQSPLSAVEIRKKIKKTNLEKFGTESPFGSIQIQEKIAETNLDRYGASNVLNKKSLVRNKVEKTTKARYGYKTSIKNPIVRQKAAATKDAKTLERKIIFLKENGFELVVDDTFKYSGVKNKYDMICLSCNSKFVSSMDDGKVPSCPSCMSRYGSKPQQDIMRFISANGIAVANNDRTVIAPMEIDLLLKKYSLGIEFDGLYWHSDLMVDDGYHLRKTEHAERNGIHLIHVFEDEWASKQSIIKSRILSMLGLNKKIFARNLTISPVTREQKARFLTDNHLFGNDSSSVWIGLFDSEEMLGLMTFSKSRYDKNHQWELVRYCSKTGINIVGGAGKLFAEFIRKNNPDSVISYCDRRWSKRNSNLYSNIGFSLIRISKPNYWYVLGDKRYNRLRFQKHKLQQLPHYDKNKSERAIMQENGYVRIFDCGQFVFSWKRI